MLPLDECYIPLGLRTGQMTEGSQLLEHEGTALLLGEPGSGKSAVLSHLTRTLCAGCIDDPDKARLPIHISLTELATVLQDVDADVTTPQSVSQALATWFARARMEPLDLYEAGNIFSTMAASPDHGVVVLLDGLDELSPAFIEKAELFIHNLSEFLRSAPGSNLTIVASRQQALVFSTAQLESLDRLITVELEPFSNEAIYSFLLSFPYRPQFDPTIEARRIFSQMRLHPTLLDTCSNPLALALYVDRDARARETGGGINEFQSETRAGFYQYIVDHLVVRRRSGQLLTKGPTLPFTLSRNKFFSDVARQHAESGEPFNHITNVTMLDNAQQIAREGQTVELALDELAKETGLVSRSEVGVWSFIHVSFLNYFLAKSLTSATSAQQREAIFASIRERPARYLEAFYLACGLMATSNSPLLPDLLTALGQNARVNQHYPRAMLESQAYLMENFPSLIRIAASNWKRKRTDNVVLRNLVAVLTDYEVTCRDLGRTPAVTVDKLLGSQLSKNGTSVAQLAQLDVELAVRLGGHETVLQMLTDRPVDDAILALYEAAVFDSVDVRSMIARPRLAAILAESALRSTLVAQELAPAPVPKTDRQIPLSRAQHRWVDVWPIRGTLYAEVLGAALPYIENIDAAKHDFPQLTLMQHVKPIRRLRYDLVFSSWRLTSVILSTVVLLSAIAWLISRMWIVSVAIAVLIVIVLGVGLRAAVLRGSIVLASSRILNLQKASEDVTDALGQSKKLVHGSKTTLKKWRLRRPREGAGRYLAFYEQALPFVWRRFSPALGDKSITAAGCAALRREARVPQLRTLLGGHSD